MKKLIKKTKKAVKKVTKKVVKKISKPTLPIEKVTYSILNTINDGMGAASALKILKEHGFDAVKTKSKFKMHDAIIITGNVIAQRKASRLLFGVV